MVKIELNEVTQKVFDGGKGRTKLFSILLIFTTIIVLLSIGVAKSDLAFIEDNYLDTILTIFSILLFVTVTSMVSLTDFITNFQGKKYNKKEFKKLGMTYKSKDERHWYATKDGEDFVSKHYDGVLYIGTKEEIESLSAYKTVMTFWSARSGDKALPPDVTEETTKFCDALDYMGSFFRVRTEKHIYVIDCLRGEWQLESILK